MGSFIPADWPGALMSGAGFALPFLAVKLLWNATQWALTFKSARSDKIEERADARDSAAFERMDGEIQRLSDECVKLRERADATEEELRHCRDEHSKCEARVKQLEATFQGYGDAKQLAALQVAADKRKDKE